MDGMPFATHRPPGSPGPMRSVALVGALLLALTLSLALAVAEAPTSQAASAVPAVTTPPPCDAYTAGRHIYDCAGLLTSDEVGALEAKAQAVQGAGAPVVVRLQVKSATFDQTLADAADLMARWNIESEPGAKDGLVILLNLTPGNLRHGQVALYAGKTLLDGPLPQSELNRIYQDVMLPELAAGQTASGIGAGLDAAAVDLRAGHPVTPAPPGQGVARAIGTIPFNVLAALLALLTLAMGWARTRRARQEAAPQPTMPTTTPPATLRPAEAGALITGRVGGAQMEATILDFARRDLLSLEPLDPRHAQIRLLSDGRDLTGYEQWLWQALTSQAAGDGVIPPERLVRVATGWRQATDTLRRQLLDRGWFDRDRGSKRLPFIVLTVVSFILVAVGVTLGALAQQLWPFIGVALCLVAGVAALVFALTVPAVTPAGREMAQPMRNYIAGVSALPPGVTVSEALPWLVAAGLASSFSQRLRMEADQQVTPYAMIYPYWLLMHASMAPPPAQGGSVAGATGAAAGGGGAGGAF